MIWNKIKIEDVKTYAPILVSVVALIISIRSCDISNEALNANKQEFEKRRESRLFVGAKWTGDKIYFSRLNKIESIGHGDLYGGLEGFIILNVTNTSDHAISLDGIGIGYCLRSSVTSIPWSGKFKSVDTQDDITFPIVLNPYEPFRCITRIPIPISESLAEMTSDLQSDTTYSSIDIVREILYYLIKREAKSFSQDSIKTIIKNETMDLANKKSLRYVPEALIGYTGPDLKVQKVSRGERALEVEVRLSSGELIVKMLDYIDINRSAFDWLSQ
jgi:hypothetical protein